MLFKKKQLAVENGSITVEQAQTPKKKLHNDKISLNLYRVLVYTILIILTILCLFPFYILLVNCSRQSSDIQQGFSWTFGTYFGKNFKNLIANTNIPLKAGFVNSLIIALFGSVLTVYFSALTAYSTTIYNFKFKKVITTFILAVMMIPTQVSALGLVIMCMKAGWTNQLWVIIVPCVASPVTYFYMKQYIEAVLPMEVIEASRVDGYGELRIFHTIALPILKPALAVQFIFAYVANWNNYFIPSLLLTTDDVKTLPLVLANLKLSSPDTFDLGQVYCLMTIAVIPVLIVYLIFSRAIIKNLTSGAVKG